MQNTRESLLKIVEAHATRRREQLTCELAWCPGQDRSAALAELEFQRWFIDSCWDCLDGA